ncbi:MAG: hypothetical protein JJE37_02505 [Methyloceanibacter sp.]|jgi:hypothetical protein|nr:hypothetical protein [Methyloceanibacter sp.]
MDLRDRVIGDLHATIGVADRAAAVGISQPIADILDGGLAALPDLGRQPCRFSLIEPDEAEAEKRHDDHAKQFLPHRNLPALSRAA